MKGRIAGLLLIIPATALAGSAQFAPPPPTEQKAQPAPQTAQTQGKGEQVEKKERSREVVLPAPEFLYREQGIDRFEREKEKLRREKELLQMKVDIARLKAELEKYRLAPEELKLKLQAESLKAKLPATVHAAPSQPAPHENPQVELQREFMKMQMERERLRMLESKLALLQNLFTGVMKVGNQRVAFDSMGRKYTVGSTVYGFQIVDVQDDGVVVAFGNQVFKVPISSGVQEKKKTQEEFQPAPAVEPPPPAMGPMGMETPPVPIQ